MMFWIGIFVGAVLYALVIAAYQWWLWHHG